LCCVARPDELAHLGARLVGELRAEPRVALLVEPSARSTTEKWNAALAAATGDYAAVLEGADALAEEALARMAEAALADPGADLVYSDEDLLDERGRREAPFFKPDWSPETLLAGPYVGRLAAYRTEFLRAAGGYAGPWPSAAEFGLALRLARSPGRAAHVADVLYHRRPAAPPPEELAACADAVRQHLAESGTEARVAADPEARGCRVRFAVRGRPKVSILVPSACRRVPLHGRPSYWAAECAASIRKCSTYRHCEIVLLHNTPVPADLADLLGHLEVRAVAYAGPFNWSRAMNVGAARADGDHLLFLNDDVEVLTPDWLEALLEWSQQPRVAAVGAKLLFPDGRLQHAGVALLDGLPRHPFYLQPGDHPGYHGSLLAPRNVSAVTGACLMTRAEVFRDLGGFDEGFAVNYNDIDYCLRALTRGRRVVVTPHARLTHHESATQAGASQEEVDAFRSRWGRRFPRDPLYSPHLSTRYLDCSLAEPPGRIGIPQELGRQG
jgi:GT2 family glycosyltransferase